jgi:putative nucleotidyltransferase with HDIG domain
MKPLARAYAIIESAIGALLGVYCTYLYIIQLQSSDNLKKELVQLMVLFVLTYFCRCFPIYIRADFALDMAFISNVAILLCKGPIVAAAITFVSSPFVIVRVDTEKRKYNHILNTPFIKSAFNYGNFTISVFLAGEAYLRVGGIIGNLSLPGVLLPMTVMVLTIMVVNCSLLILLFKLNSGINFFSSMLKNTLEYYPSVLAATPIGFFISKFMILSDGEYLVLLFLLPLFLARYSFSLYIEVKHNYYIMIKTLTYSLEAKDEYTRGHSERVELYAKEIAKEMRLSHARIENITVAALLHDVGKIGIDESILRKPASLTPEERAIIQKHPVISVHILKEVKLPPIVFELILHHHERYDGKGYPDGISGENLPIETSILSVADTYDAMTSIRPYSPGFTAEQTKKVIMEEKGKQFHPKVVDAFVKAYDKGNMALIERDYKNRDFGI